MPSSEEISEEGFGYFRGTWFMGRVPVAEAQAVVDREGEMLRWLDGVATDADAFEILATAIEHHDVDELPAPLRERALDAGLEQFVGAESDPAELGALEIGVAGLCHVLSAVRCLTAASCRSHTGEHSWSDCPVVFFAAPAWRVEILADLIATDSCGLDADRGMLKIYGRSVSDLHRLAEAVLVDRGRLRRIPEHRRPQRRPRAPMSEEQLHLGE